MTITDDVAVDATARHDPEAEASVIGAAMLDPRVIDDCHVRAGDFYRPEHEQLWQVITGEHRAGRPVDGVSLLHRTGHIRGLDAARLSTFMRTVPTASNGPQYAQIVAGLAVLRRLAEAGTRLQQLAASTSWDAAVETVDAARGELEAVAALTTATADVRTFHDALTDAMIAWGEPNDGRVHPTGWRDLDDILNGGWRPGHLTIVGARPAVGKSLLAGCAALQCARAGNATGFFALEMAEIEVTARIAAAASNVDISRIEQRTMHDVDWRKLADLHGASENWPLYIDDRSRLSMAQIRAMTRTWSRKGPLALVVVDYLQLVRAANESGDNRERQVSRIAEDLKLLAREFDTHVLALAQVGRGPANRGDKRPTMSDLRESGGQEAHADEVILLHRDDEETPGEIELLVEKNRHGRTGKVVLAWAPHYASARDLYREVGR